MGYLRNVRFIALLLFLFTLSACSGMVDRWGKHSQLDRRAETINVIAVAPPNVKIYQLTAGGVRDLMDEWCDTGARLFTNTAIEQLDKKTVKAKSLQISDDISKDLNDINSLYDAIALSINWHTFIGDEDFFPHKRENFDYSVGSIESILKRTKADALLVVTAYDEISTGGRKALMAVGNVLSVIPGFNVGPHEGYTVVSMALFDKTGAMLWYNQLGSVGQLDLREQDSVNVATRELLRTFPRIGK